MNAEAKIISQHNLDCSSLENLANDIAKRLNCNLEFGQYQSSNGKHEFVKLGAVTLNSKGISTTLYDMTNDNASEYNYVLELGDEAKLIYSNIINILPPWEEDFDTVFNNFNSREFIEEPYYTGVFDELRKLGSDKVYFIKDTHEPELSIKVDINAQDYIQQIKDKATLFEVVL